MTVLEKGAQMLLQEMRNGKERRGEEDRLREVIQMWMLLRRIVRWRRWTTIERLKDMIVLGCACVHHADQRG